MSKEIKLQLIKEGNFLGTKCDFYKDDDNSDITLIAQMNLNYLKYYLKLIIIYIVLTNSRKHLLLPKV